VKTKDKIIFASLQLFNEKGERNVTTNHIAAHLSISPGNLYYHFKNKNEIIFDIYEMYENLVDSFLVLPEERALTINDKVNYLNAVFEGLWQFRFLHRDMEHLLASSEGLHQRYQAFFKRCLHKTELIYLGLNASGIINGSERDLKSLAFNTWIIVTNWFSVLHTNLLVPSPEKITKEFLQAGIHQIFALERPYITDQYRDEVLEIEKKYQSIDTL
jgi:AcrR family transcriptional regulator